MTVWDAIGMIGLALLINGIAYGNAWMIAAPVLAFGAVEWWLP